MGNSRGKLMLHEAGPAPALPKVSHTLDVTPGVAAQQPLLQTPSAKTHSTQCDTVRRKMLTHHPKLNGMPCRTVWPTLQMASRSHQPAMAHRHRPRTPAAAMHVGRTTSSPARTEEKAQAHIFCKCVVLTYGCCYRITRHCCPQHSASACWRVGPVQCAPCIRSRVSGIV